jgi:ligand-binding SRPBCC domain-containing protein
MKQLEFKQFLPISIEEAWDFFATPKNLDKITPENVRFQIISDLPEKMTTGTVIVYRIKPFLNISFDWVTEISFLEEYKRFIDEQRKGPYRVWRHEHYFEPTDGGVMMTDKLSYDIGKSVFGWLAGELFVHKKVKEIFKFRYQKLEVLFPKKT